MPIPAHFNGRRLQRHAWTLPFTLTLTPLLLLVAYVAAPVIWDYPQVLLQPVDLGLYVWETLTPWPFGIAAAISLVAYLRGMTFGSSARSYLNKRLEVRELASTEPLAVRVHRIADALNLPRPRVAIMPIANAYAIGTSRNDAAVVIGRPLIQHLSEPELDAIIGHELGHIVSGDMKRMQMAAGYQSLIRGGLDVIVETAERIAKGPGEHPIPRLIAWLFAMAFKAVVGFFGDLSVKRLSRSREYVADAFGAMASTPEAMISALSKLHGIDPPAPKLSQAHQNLMFWSPGNNWFSTHPSYHNRVAAVERGAHVDRLLRRGGSWATIKRPGITRVAVPKSPPEPPPREEPTFTARPPVLATPDKPQTPPAPKKPAPKVWKSGAASRPEQWFSFRLDEYFEKDDEPQAAQPGCAQAAIPEKAASTPRVYARPQVVSQDPRARRILPVLIDIAVPILVGVVLCIIVAGAH